MGDPEKSGEAAGEFLKGRRQSLVVRRWRNASSSVFLHVKINSDQEFFGVITLDFLTYVQFS